MNKKYGWTLAELSIAMIFVMIIAGTMASVFKPKTQNHKIQIYAAIRNMEKGIIAINDKYEKGNVNTGNDGVLYQKEGATKSTFCTELADVFSLAETANCANGYDMKKPNLVLSNGAAIYGLASDTVHVSEKAHPYKNIMIDIDGSKGANKLGSDRFPLRIYAKENTILPVDCTETQFYAWEAQENKMVTLSAPHKNPYCKKGKEFTGSVSDINFLLDDEIITYDIHAGNAAANTKNNKFKIAALTQSPAAAICGVLGGSKYLSESQCASMGLKIHAQCPTKESCEKCSTVSPSICPMNEAGTAQISSSQCEQLYNSLGGDEHLCIMLLHKPSAAMSAIVGSIVGDLDME